jgi:translation initiation factor 2 subunit 1
MMLLRRQGWPEEGELVICTVTKVTGNSVFANLDEYGRTGMIHISEVSPGRIRNIRDFVEEGRVVVCKIINIDRERGYIDLSLRRVSEMMRQKKMNEMKQEQKAEKIIEMVAKSLKIEVRRIYEAVASKTLEKYGFLYSAFEDVALKNISLSDFGVEKKYADVLDEAIRQKIKPPKVEISGTLRISTFVSDGIDVIKAALKPAESAEDVKLSYLGNGQYLIKLTASDYKSGEKKLKPIVDFALEYVEKHDGKASFERKEE